MARFEPAYRATNEREGLVLSNVATDRGGMTFGGISRKWHPNWEGWVLIDAGDRGSQTLMNLHYKFYKTKFWDQVNGDRLSSQEHAEKFYDAAVNVGVSRAASWAQVALNVCNQRGKLYPDVAVTGTFNPETVVTLDKLLAQADGRRRWLFMQVYETQQEMHYVTLALKDPSQEANLLGWYTHRIHHRVKP